MQEWEDAGIVSPSALGVDAPSLRAPHPLHKSTHQILLCISRFTHMRRSTDQPMPDFNDHC